jgi:hypothetical protein
MCKRSNLARVQSLNNIGMFKMFKSSFVKRAGVICMVLVAVAACRSEEQDRVLRFEQGVMKQIDPSAQLTQEELAALRLRAIKQGGAQVGGGATGGIGVTGANVRPPEVKTQ